MHDPVLCTVYISLIYYCVSSTYCAFAQPIHLDNFQFSEKLKIIINCYERASRPFLPPPLPNLNSDVGKTALHSGKMKGGGGGGGGEIICLRENVRI